MVLQMKGIMCHILCSIQLRKTTTFFKQFLTMLIRNNFILLPMNQKCWTFHLFDHFFIVEVFRGEEWSKFSSIKFCQFFDTQKGRDQYQHPRLPFISTESGWASSNRSSYDKYILRPKTYLVYKVIKGN